MPKKDAPKSTPAPSPNDILERIFEGAPEFFVVLDSDLKVSRAGSAFREAVGFKDKGDLSFLDTVERFSLSRVREIFETLRDGASERETLEINHRRKSGAPIPVRYSWMSCTDDGGKCRAFVGIGREVRGAEESEDAAKLADELETARADLERRTQEIARLRKELLHQATRDELTGLGNRRFLMERLEIETARAIRYDQPMTLILLDVDRMTHVNETHGQEMGDEVLKQVAAVVQDQIRQTDLAGRYVSEEFLILCPSTDRASAQFLAERLRRRVAELSFTNEDEEFGVTVSVGLVTVDGQNEFDTEAILHAAEQALESAKTGGMNRVRVLEVV
jgi:diguanylate cyclase (GGDEF)-like protein/PAS domain S-box-containing protein